MGKYNPVEVLESIFRFYDGEQFINDRETIHSAFYKIRKEHFDMLEEMTFRDNLLFPRSRVLDELLSSLQPDFLGKINPTYDTYQIKTENLRKLWNSQLKAILGDREAELKEMATKLKAFLADA